MEKKKGKQNKIIYHVCIDCGQQLLVRFIRTWLWQIYYLLSAIYVDDFLSEFCVIICDDFFAFNRVQKEGQLVIKRRCWFLAWLEIFSFFLFVPPLLVLSLKKWTIYTEEESVIIMRILICPPYMYVIQRWHEEGFM